MAKSVSLNWVRRRYAIHNFLKVWWVFVYILGCVLLFTNSLYEDSTPMLAYGTWLLGFSLMLDSLLLKVYFWWFVTFKFIVRRYYLENDDGESEEVYLIFDKNENYLGELDPAKMKDMSLESIDLSEVQHIINLESSVQGFVLGNVKLAFFFAFKDVWSRVRSIVVSDEWRLAEEQYKSVKYRLSKEFSDRLYERYHGEINHTISADRVTPGGVIGDNIDLFQKLLAEEEFDDVIIRNIVVAYQPETLSDDKFEQIRSMRIQQRLQQMVNINSDDSNMVQ